MDIIKQLRDQSNFKLFLGAIIVFGIFYIVFFNPYDDEYYEEAGKELVLARAICENSADWALANPERLKIDDNKLDHIKVDGKLVKLEHVKYPRAILLHDGFGHPNAQVEFYCTFEDPRGNTGLSFYYDYRRRAWTDKTISRR